MCSGLKNVRLRIHGGYLHLGAKHNTEKHKYEKGKQNRCKNNSVGRLAMAPTGFDTPQQPYLGSMFRVCKHTLNCPIGPYPDWNADSKTRQRRTRKKKLVTDKISRAIERVGGGVLKSGYKPGVGGSGGLQVVAGLLLLHPKSAEVKFTQLLP